MNDRILYLVRVISRKCFDELMNVPSAERQLTSTLGYMPTHEFPGVCATLVTEQTVQSAKETLYTGSVLLFLDARLLKDRTDYHFNVSDQNGFIGIDTLYPWDLHTFIESGRLPKAIEKCGDDFFGNEVVFHNPIPWSSVHHYEIKGFEGYVFDLLPKWLIRTNTKHFRNESYLPYFALPTPPSQVQNRCTKDEDIIEAKTKLLHNAWSALMQGKSSEYLYLNRHEQNIKAFQQHQQAFALSQRFDACACTRQGSATPERPTLQQHLSSQIRCHRQSNTIQSS